MKRILSLIFVLALFTCVPITGSESSTNEEKVDELYQPKYIATSRIDTLLVINSSGKATISGKVYGSSLVDHASIYVFLEKMVNNNWSTIKMLSKDSNSSYVFASAELIVAKGYDYKVVVYTYVYDEDDKLIEHLVRETDMESYR